MYEKEAIQATFTLHSRRQPTGSHKKLTEGRPGISTLIGVTGSGKTFTMANVIANQNKPVLILAPNKTLAAQFYEEFSLFFPENKVCYFVSYYDYYQPESYLPAQDIYIPKETKVNSEIERLRVEATASLINRHDTIIIASVSCIYSLGNPDDYRNLAFPLKLVKKLNASILLTSLFLFNMNAMIWKKPRAPFKFLVIRLKLTCPIKKKNYVLNCLAIPLKRLQWVDKHE